jgi:intracellular sulfur oxidation DsrE/DsrF family protein
MHRRNMLTAAIASASAAFATAMATKRADAAAPNKAPDASKVVYHLSDADKAEFALGNIRNHYNGMGGPANVTIALVVHGPALKAFHLKAANPEVTKRLDEMVKLGLSPAACINTMRAQEVTLKDLLPGFTIADKGGVVRMAELQAQGYAYLRP